jgi:transcription elongation factor Elf1
VNVGLALLCPMWLKLACLRCGEGVEVRYPFTTETAGLILACGRCGRHWGLNVKDLSSRSQVFVLRPHRHSGRRRGGKEEA